MIWLSHFSRSSSELGGGILNETTPFSHLPLLPIWHPFTRHFMFFALFFKNIFWINFLSLVFIHYNVIFMSVITSLLFKKTILLSWNFVIGQVPIWIFLLLFIWLWSDPEKKNHTDVIAQHLYRNPDLNDCIHFFSGTDSRIFSNIKSFSKSYLLIWFSHFSRSNSEVGRPYLLPWLFNNFPSLLPSPKWHPLTRHDGMMIKVFSVFYFFREINFTKIASLIISRLIVDAVTFVFFNEFWA